MAGWGAKSIPETLTELGSNATAGLSKEEAFRRLATYGPNQLIEDPPRSLLSMLFDQFKDFLVLILIASTIIAAVMGELLDAAVILGIVILNAVLGVIQEGRAERSLAALRRMAVPEATIIRDGKQIRVQSHDLVPGDLVLLQAGDVVPADLRLLEAVNLRTDESPLTGESLPVEKSAETLAAHDAAIGDQPDLAFLGTTVVYGRGRGLVVETGMKTEIGKIAALVVSVEEAETPLQRKLAQFGRWLGLACLGICAVVFALGVLRGENPFVMFMTAVSLAVAAIPEGLPATVTIVLALGVQRMIARNAIIRRLPAVETLGCATFVCSDKTGTLTENKMTVTEVYPARGERITVSGRGYEIEGEFAHASGQMTNIKSDSDLLVLLQASLACNDASVTTDGTGAVSVLGDPTEAALVVMAAKGGLDRERLSTELPRIQEIPFDSTRKRMTTVHQHGDRRLAFTKGAPDILLTRCDRFLADGQERPLDQEKIEEYTNQISVLAGRGLRILGVARRYLEHGQEKDWDKDLCFLGLVGMQDPVREEAKAAVSTCLRAGIRPVMVTGDYPQTARAIAGELGLGDSEVLTGSHIEDMSQTQLGDSLAHTSVFARVSPEHKLRIVEALRSRGEVVAMTGDGVNDAPALRSADIGVAMGRGGTEVAKGASDMVLADDNFATIVAAIEEGRVIFENILKVVVYLLSCNIGELLLFFVAIMAGLPAPLVPVQILLINLVTDGLPALALGVEPRVPGIMEVPPRDPRTGILNRAVMVRLCVIGTFTAAAALIPFIALEPTQGTGNHTLARTAAFAALAFTELWWAISIRSERLSIWKMPFFGNPQLIMAIASSAVITLAVIYLPSLNSIFKTVALGPAAWAIIIPSSFLPMIAGEIIKLVKTKKRK